MGIVNFGINKELVKTLAKKFEIKNFIETGTYLGGTSVWASGIFPTVHTVEFSEEIYKTTSTKFKDVKNITFHFGNSKDVLPQVIPTIKGSTLFWLDGHWCGRNTAGKYTDCPIFAELEQAVKVEKPAILIDDLRYFLGPNPNDHGENYPTLQSVINYLTKALPTHFITIHDDTLICVPAEYQDTVDADWKKYYHKRYPATLKPKFAKLWWRLKRLDFKPESTN